MRKPVFVVSMFALTLAVAPACATKKFVRTEVGQVNDKVTTMGSSLEQTQERVRQAEGRITEVDTKAGAAQSSAEKAQQAANSANDAAAGPSARDASANPTAASKTTTRKTGLAAAFAKTR